MLALLLGGAAKPAPAESESAANDARAVPGCARADAEAARARAARRKKKAMKKAMKKGWSGVKKTLKQGWTLAEAALEAAAANDDEQDDAPSDDDTVATVTVQGDRPPATPLRAIPRWVKTPSSGRPQAGPADAAPAADGGGGSSDTSSDTSASGGGGGGSSGSGSDARIEAPVESGAGVMPWLGLGRLGLEVKPEGQAVFSATKGAVHVVVAMGELRCGKSTLLNALIKRASGGAPEFKVSSAAKSCTTGVDVTGVLTVGLKHAVVFADMEGQRDRGLSRDVQLATPLLLVASAVLLVVPCTTGPSKVNILDALAVAMAAAMLVSERRDRRGIFGTLHVVLRGCGNSEKDCLDIIFGVENASTAETDDEAVAVEQRNGVRAAVAVAFSGEARVWCLPSVADDEIESDAKYSKKVTEVHDALCLQFAERPRKLFASDVPLTGCVIAAMLPQVKRALERHGASAAIDPPCVVDAIAQGECARFQLEVLRDAEAAFEAFDRKLPILEPEASDLAAHLQRSVAAPLLCKLEALLELWQISSPQSAENARRSCSTMFDFHAKALCHKNQALLATRAAAEATTRADFAAERRLAEARAAAAVEVEKERRDHAAIVAAANVAAANAAAANAAADRARRATPVRVVYESQSHSYGDGHAFRVVTPAGPTPNSRSYATPTTSYSTPSRSYGGSPMGAVLKQDGTQDRRYTAPRHVTQSGAPDRRYRENR
ncbi:hypothetical protein M885DRAFT_524851 [Pelagophyceae sp. CCMP2097]|nr:hypothetical protein M885DRAFT_524851 [Pelagophyceae sp. CCMP2097]